LEYFKAIWYIVYPFGNFEVVGNVFTRLGKLYQEKSGNPDALVKPLPVFWLKESIFCNSRKFCFQLEMRCWPRRLSNTGCPALPVAAFPFPFPVSQLIARVESRVTGLGKFSPIGRVFSLGNLLKICK
jgi:hypothetical protein